MSFNLARMLSNSAKETRVCHLCVVSFNLAQSLYMHKIYPHGFAHPRHRLSRAGSTTWKPAIGVAPHRPPKRVKMVTNGRQFGTIYDKSVLGGTLGPTWGAPGSKKTPDTKKYKKCPEQV